MQSCISGLWVLAGDPRQIFHGLYPPLYFLRNPSVLSRPVSEKKPKVTTPRDKIDTHDTEEIICPCRVPLGHNQDNLGWFW